MKKFSIDVAYILFMGLVLVGLTSWWLSNFQEFPYATIPEPPLFTYDAMGTSDTIIQLDIPPASGPITMRYGSDAKDLFKLELYDKGETMKLWACAASCDREAMLKLMPRNYVLSVRCNRCAWYVIMSNEE